MQIAINLKPQRPCIVLKCSVLLTVGFLVVFTRVPRAAAPGVIGINFVGSGMSMSAGESAGVVAKANWNNAIGATRSTSLALADDTAAASGASVTWASRRRRMPRRAAR